MCAQPHITRRSFLERTLKAAAAGAASADAITLAGASETSPAEVERWHVGCYTRPWVEHDWRVAMDAIAEAGFVPIADLEVAPNELETWSQIALRILCDPRTPPYGRPSPAD